MSENDVHLLYDVTFMTWSKPNPERLGTAERQGARIRVWAKNGEEAMDLAKQIARAEGADWLGMLSTDAVQGVILESILNDPLNPHNKLALLGNKLTLVEGE